LVTLARSESSKEDQDRYYYYLLYFTQFIYADIDIVTLATDFDTALSVEGASNYCFVQHDIPWKPAPDIWGLQVFNDCVAKKTKP
jgi:hypothetical protein